MYSRYQNEDSRLNTVIYFQQKGEKAKARICKQFFATNLAIKLAVEEKRISAHGEIIFDDFWGKHGNHATVSTALILVLINCRS